MSLSYLQCSLFYNASLHIIAISHSLQLTVLNNLETRILQK